MTNFLQTLNSSFTREKGKEKKIKLFKTLFKSLSLLAEEERHTLKTQTHALLRKGDLDDEGRV